MKQEYQKEPGNNTTPSFIDKPIRFFLEKKVITFLMILLFIGWGLTVAPFDWNLGWIPQAPVPVDAIPDIGENQQIVFTKWAGRSPQDIEDQITYPLTVSLLGVPGVKTIRSYSMFGFSTIYIIFKEDVGFYWSRSRILEKLNSLPSDTLPDGVKPSLGPDATALGQVYWYTLEGLDKNGKPTGGWNLEELRTIQDWYVRYALLSVDGISDVASVGGFVKEYQIDVDPDAMRSYKVGLREVVSAIKMSNIDVGAGVIEINKAEYVIRGTGFVKSLKDLENAVIKVKDNVPIYVKDVAKVTTGPAPRRGALDKEGAEAVGGVVVVRYGENPLSAIKNLKRKIKEISPGLPKKILSDGTVSQVKIVPFYDRTGLIHETLGTLDTALTEEILITIIVVLIMMVHLRSSLLISGLLPLAVLMCFIAMKIFGVDANVVAFSGIAIAIGTMVDMGIVICENILKRLESAGPQENSLEVIFNATKEVGGAVLTAVSTTIISFLPVFTMKAAEGKLFRPLAFTKTFALIASVIVAITVIPPLAHILFTKKGKKLFSGFIWIPYIVLIFAGILIGWTVAWWAGSIVVILSLYQLTAKWFPVHWQQWLLRIMNWAIAFVVVLILTKHWLPLGPEKGTIKNFLFVILIISSPLTFFYLFQLGYPKILRWCLNHKILFLIIPAFVVLWGGLAWQGFNSFFSWLPQSVKHWKVVKGINDSFPGLGKEFMPPLDEGAFLYMPTTMPHASIGEAMDILQKQDMVISQIPEIESVVGKIGRADTPLDPAPISMAETIINYKPEYITDRNGKRLRFRFVLEDTDLFRDQEGLPVPAPDGKPYTVYGRFERDKKGNLIPDPDGMPFRLWRPPMNPVLNKNRQPWKGIKNPDDIWMQIVTAAEVPGSTSSPKLQPIMTRIIMLQTGMRAPMGIKVRGPDLDTIEKVGLQIEKFLKEVPSIEPSTVIADRIVGKPYLEIAIDRQAIARYGIMLRNVQDVIETAIGGKKITTTVEGRERYSVRVRYMRELRDSMESLGRILVSAPNGAQIPLNQISTIHYVRGPQVIKSEDTSLVGYVVFDKKAGHAEVDVVNDVKDFLREKMKTGEFKLPSGVSYTFAGNYKNQIRAQKTLAVVLPIALLLIFLILYFQFSSISTTLLVFSGIVVAWAGGFIMIWLYAQPWFLDIAIFGRSMRELFQVHQINLSVAIWVGFLALFGIASDDGVVVATYLNQSFARKKVSSIKDIKDATISAAVRRIRPALMTSATTILALIPVLTSTGRGSDIMVPMAIPSFGGMFVALITVMIVPVLYCAIEEYRLKRNKKQQ